MTNEEAYQDCIQHCIDNRAWATHTALTEDGYDPKIDWIKMLTGWNNAKEEKMLTDNKIGGYTPATRRQQLEMRKQELTEALRRVDAAIAALDENPSLEQFIETLSKAGL